MNKALDTQTTPEIKPLDKPKLWQLPLAWVRKLYDWVLSWANSPFGSYAMFGFSFAEASFFPVPPDPLLIALTLEKRKKALLYALICTTGSITGGIFGYFIGFEFMKEIGIKIIDFYNARAIFHELLTTFSRHSFVAILIAAITPIPYKVFTITAGFAAVEVLGQSALFNNHIFFQLVAASCIGRGLRFGLIALLIYLFGPPIKEFIERYFNILVVVFTVLLAGGFFLIKVLSS